MAQEMTTRPKREAVPAATGVVTRPALVYRPNTDIYETDDHIVVIADMPGVATADIDVNLERRILTIRGHVSPKTQDGYRPMHTEYGEGDFERVFTLSEEIDRDRIEANHKNGVLTLKLPKAESAKTRKIAVKAG